jgi:uncharacterized protein YutE (UPF0331/DUF86 family)
MANPHSRELVTSIVENVEFVEECLTILAEKQAVDFPTYRDDAETRDIVERRFEKATQACIDIARILLRDIDGTAPDTYAKAMQRLGKRNVLQSSTATEMARAAQFRNVLAHEYGDVIDDEVV